MSVRSFLEQHGHFYPGAYAYRDELWQAFDGRRTPSREFGRLLRAACQELGLSYDRSTRGMVVNGASLVPDQRRLRVHYPGPDRFYRRFVVRGEKRREERMPDVRVPLRIADESAGSSSDASKAAAERLAWVQCLALRRPDPALASEAAAAVIRSEEEAAIEKFVRER